MQYAQKPAPAAVASEQPEATQDPATLIVSEKFLYGLAHDMRGNLRALAELPVWIEEDLKYKKIEVPSDVQEYLSMMRDHAGQMSNLLEGFMSLIRAGRTPDEPHRATVQEVARAAWDALEPDEQFKLETHDALDTVYLPKSATATLFKAILENTQHHHDKSKGHVRVTSETDGDRVRILVEDDGPGIPKDERARVFDPLTRLRRREETGRAGLGLTLARKIVTKMGGEISVTKASNARGTAVTFDLPVRERW